MNYIIMQRIVTKIFLEGFESIEFSSDDLIYLINNKHNLHVNKEYIMNLRYFTDIDELPITFEEKNLIKQEIYNQGIKYVDNSKERTFKDLKKETIVSLWLRNQRKIEEKKEKGLCPKCGKLLGEHINSNYCVYCGCDLRKIGQYKL